MERDEEREPGFYWVKTRPENPWVPAQWVGGNWWMADVCYYPHLISTIGPRIEPPRDGAGEINWVPSYLTPSQAAGLMAGTHVVVPREPTPQMMWAVERHHSFPTTSSDHRVSIYRAMVAAATEEGYRAMLAASQEEGKDG